MTDPKDTTVKATIPYELWARARARGLVERKAVSEVVREALTLWLGEGPPPADLGSPPAPSRKAGDR